MSIGTANPIRLLGEQEPVRPHDPTIRFERIYGKERASLNKLIPVADAGDVPVYLGRHYTSGEVRELIAVGLIPAIHQDGAWHVNPREVFLQAAYLRFVAWHKERALIAFPGTATRVSAVKIWRYADSREAIKPRRGERLTLAQAGNELGVRPTLLWRLASIARVSHYADQERYHVLRPDLEIFRSLIEGPTT